MDAAKRIVEPLDPRSAIGRRNRSSLVPAVEPRGAPLAVEIEIVADRVLSASTWSSAFDERIADVRGEPLPEPAREPRLQAVVLALGAKLDHIDRGVAAEGADRVGRVVRRRIGNRVAKGKLIDVPEVGEVRAAVADIRCVDGEPPGQLMLYSGVPRIGARRVALDGSRRRP